MENLTSPETFSSHAGRIKAELVLRKGNYHSGGFNIQTQNSGYVGEVTFYAGINPEFQLEPGSVKVSYTLNQLGDLFFRLKEAEEGIELLLKDSLDRCCEWKRRKEVQTCIVDLERQVAVKYSQRR